MTRIEIIFFAWSDLRVPYIDGELVGDGNGLAIGYATQVLAWYAQISINNDADIVETQIPVTLTQMAALIGKKPETIEEAKEVVASYD